MKFYRLYKLAIVLLFAFFLTTQSWARETPLEGLDARIESMMADWVVPGASVAIVKDDAVILSRGYGVLEVGQNRPANDQTLFAIGSASKAFTAAAIAILIDEGKLSWDDPVTDHLPWFKLYDPYATREIRVRDLLAHNSGLSRGDRVWYGTGMSREDIVRQARYMPPTKSFRSTFQYNNTMFIAAGLVIEAVSGQSWDDYVNDRILVPLGMNSSNTSVTDLEDLPNVATPHMDFGGIARPVPWRKIDNAGPAGSINSNVRDMIQWVRLQLGGGEFQGERIISEQNVREMRTSQMIMRKEGFYEQIFSASSLINYGLGWFLMDYRGTLMVTHGGNIDGNSAYVSFLPDKNIGLVVLTNMNGANGFIAALNNEIYDRFLGSYDTDWSGKLLQVFEEAKAKNKERVQKIRDSRVEGTSPSLPLEAYAGAYDHQMYPGITVSLRDGKLLATYADVFEAELEHWHFDTFQATWNLPDTGDGPPNLMRFVLDTSGKATTVHADIEGEIPFTRRADEESE
jgi:CubicO group peptidase (beta-lactamase class C family)